MKKDVAHILRRSERFQVILIGEGILAGAVAGLVALGYRILLEQAGTWLNLILQAVRGSLPGILAWFGALAVLAAVVAALLKFEPLISGSGIPQLEGEMTGKLTQTWWKILPAKFLGGFLCMLGGLALGREGPSIQLGAMAGKGISHALDRSRTEEKYLLTCGAAAGLSAAFQAPLAGVMFSLEEVHKNFSVSVLVSVMSASLTADYLASRVMGTDTVFQFPIAQELPTGYYGLLLLLGVILGAGGAFYNWFTLKSQKLYGRLKTRPFVKMLIPFLTAGVLGLCLPQVLGSGHSLVEWMTGGECTLGMVALVVAVRFLFGGISFGSGAPGGIFFPPLVLGAGIGALFGLGGTALFGISPEYLNNFVLLAMAGYFTAIVRAPLTGIILIFEMTGSVSQMLSLSLVSITAYVTATLLRSKPIYESLLDSLLRKNGISGEEGNGEKILNRFAVAHGSAAANQKIRDVDWPENCLVVSLERGDEELIPRGKTEILPGDLIVIMSEEQENGRIYDQMTRLCREREEK